MQNVVGTTIYLTRGDTFRTRVGMKLRGSDEEYIPAVADGTGHVYVNADLVNAYKADSAWAAYASVIAART